MRLLNEIATMKEARMREIQEIKDSATESTYLNIPAVDNPRITSLVIRRRKLYVFIISTFQTHTRE